MGNGPPQNADPADYWARITQRPRPLSPEVSLRIRGVEDEKKVRFRVLTADELSAARVQAHKDTKAKLGDDATVGNLAYEEEYLQNVYYQMLAAAARQADDDRFPFFPTARDVRKHLTDDEIAVAVHAYTAFRRECGPILSELTPEEMEAWVKLLQEGGSRVPLARLSGEALGDLVTYLASRLPRASSTGTSSPGSPPGESSTPSEPPDAVASSSL